MILKLRSPQIFLYFLIFFIGNTTLAQGDLMIMPKRIVFDGSQRSQEINLANTGEDTAIYAISFVNYMMGLNGNFIKVTEPAEGQRFAADFLRYFPRRVTLPPNEAQTIRIQLTRTGNLQPGEYRSHMYFRAVQERTALGTEKKSENAEGISIQIDAVFGISIPIIIREGETTTSITLTNPELNLSGEKPVLSLVINRDGNTSVYGDLTVNHISPGGVTTEIGMVKGISVYTPNNKRNFTFELQEANLVDLNSGKLEIIYIDSKQNISDKTEILLND